jgi:hypothetical protein
MHRDLGGNYLRGSKHFQSWDRTKRNKTTQTGNGESNSLQSTWSYESFEVIEQKEHQVVVKIKPEPRMS